MKRLAPLALATVLACAAPLAAQTLESTVLMAGNPAGRQSVEHRADGTFAVHFEFTDRGRGPKLDAVYRLGADGLPVTVTVGGNEYMKQAVAERFAVADGRATWTNRGEHGDAAAAHAFYTSYDSVPEEAALLASALLAAPDRRLALLPGGEARAAVVATRSVAGAGGRALDARLVELDGLGFAPTLLWLDPDGHLFASASPWFSVVRRGFERALPDLQAQQDERTRARTRALAATLPRRFPNGLVVRHARLFDSEAKRIHEGWSVLVAGDRIAAVGPDAEVDAPTGAETLDAAGATLLPGLWDMHTHVGEDDGILDVAAGVLAARDLGNDVDTVTRLRREWESGETIGPRLVLAGLLDGPGPYAGPTQALVSTFDEAKPWIDRFAALGYAQVKLYSSLAPELVAPIARYAHGKGLRVSGHVPAFMTAERAVRAGYDEIQHANMLVLNFLDDVADTRTPARFTAVALRAADLDLAGERVNAFLDLLAERDTVIDPTLSIFEGMFTARAGEPSPDLAAVADRLPPTVRRSLLGGGLPLPAGSEERARASFRALEALVVAAWRHGIPVVAGTDSLAGFALHRELELYAEAGIPNLDVLQLATLGAARIAGRDRELGAVRPGRLADFVLVDGRPDERMSDVRRVVRVVRGGALLDPAALYAAVGVAPAVPARP